MNKSSILLGALVLILYAPEVLAQGSASVPDPVENLSFALPAEVDVDSGANNGDAIILRLMPLYSFPVNDTWKLVNLDLVTFADAPGGRPGQSKGTIMSSNQTARRTGRYGLR